MDFPEHFLDPAHICRGVFFNPAELVPVTGSGGISQPVATMEAEYPCSWCGMELKVSMIAGILSTHLGMGLLSVYK